MQNAEGLQKRSISQSAECERLRLFLRMLGVYTLVVYDSIILHGVHFLHFSFGPALGDRLGTATSCS